MVSSPTRAGSKDAANGTVTRLVRADGDAATLPIEQDVVGVEGQRSTDGRDAAAPASAKRGPGAVRLVTGAEGDPWHPIASAPGSTSRAGTPGCQSGGRSAEAYGIAGARIVEALVMLVERAREARDIR